MLVTAGGTREAIDSVRFIGNSSSGRMGLALAGRGERGAEVVLLCANVALDAPPGVRRVDVVSAEQLRAACEQEFPACDVLLMAAAVADFAPATASDGKIKKDGREGLPWPWRRRWTSSPSSPDAGATPDPGRLRRRARPRRPGGGGGKLTGKRLDALVVNDISREDIGFDVEERGHDPDGRGGRRGRASARRAGTRKRRRVDLEAVLRHRRSAA